MAVEWSFFLLVGFLPALILGGLATYVWRKQATHEAWEFIALLIAIAIWSFASGLGKLFVGLGPQLALLKLSYIGIAFAAPATLLVVLRATGRESWMTRRNLVLLAAEPVVALALAATNELHGQTWSRVTVDASGSTPSLALTPGPAFWFHAFCANVEIVAAVGMLIGKYAKRWKFYRSEAYLVLMGLAAPWISSLVYLSQLRSGPALDLTPAAFLVTGVALTSSLLWRGGLLDVVRPRPIRDEIIDAMSDGVLAVDLRERLVYINSAARTILDLTHIETPSPLEVALSGSPQLIALMRGDLVEPQALTPETESEPTTYDLHVTSLFDGTGVLTGHSLVLRDITERLQSERRIRSLAFYDGLTGLPNRQRFQRSLEKALHAARVRREIGALLFVDLNRFKEVNDRMGHSAGDDLLREVAARLQECVRFSDPVGRAEPDVNSPVSRLGGDEFTILLGEIGDPLDAAKVAQRMLDLLSAPFEIDRQEVFSGASVGIAVFPHDGLDADTLLRSADQAMYHAKRSGRSSFEFFDESMNEASARKHEIEIQLNRAIRRGEMSLCFQPVLDTRTGSLSGAEALLRWKSETLGEVSPTEFIPIAEETGLIVSIGAWVLRTACAQHRAWRDAGYAPIRLAVNLSSRQLGDPALPDEVAQVLEETEMSPAHLELEITESAILRADDSSDAVLARLREMGIGLALDDFGTGYSSLSHLRRVELDRIKIDRSFVGEIPNNKEDSKLTAAIIAMAHSLNLSVVAEGVETEEQVAFLRNRGCDELQGMLLGSPIDGITFERYLVAEKDD